MRRRALCAIALITLIAVGVRVQSSAASQGSGIPGLPRFGTTTTAIPVTTTSAPTTSTSTTIAANPHSSVASGDTGNTGAPSGNSGSSGAGSAGFSNFAGTASAFGVEVNISIPNYLIISNFVDGGGPTAEAQLDSLGTSQGFASFPYPGETAVSLTGLAGILTGLSLPSYPLIVNSSYPTTDQDAIDQPAYHLHAQSGQSSSSSLAQLGETTQSGSVAGGALSTASVTAESGGSVVSKAETQIGLTIGAISLTGLDATAQVTQAADGTITKTSSLQIAHLTVAGLPIGITDQGLEIGSTKVPIGGIDAVTKLFSIPGTQIQFIPQQSTADSVTSAALQIITSQKIPSINQTADVTLTVGNVVASANGSLFSSSGSQPSSLTTSGISAGDLGSSVSTLGNSLLGGSLGFASPSASQAPTTQSQQGTTRTVTRYSLVGVPLSISNGGLFPMLLLSGAILLTIIILGRNRVRSPWKS